MALKMQTKAAVARTSAVRPAVVRPRMTVRASAQKPEQRAVAAVTAGVISGVGAMMANPLVAEAAVTPSLKARPVTPPLQPPRAPVITPRPLPSLVAGGVVLAGIAGAITAVSTFDPVKRG
ncbi:photosystem II reaction center X [Raphidocelis subcapitata]|uniref:Photosystem II reaction center X n=1 Tax=Raphidocelis subcapitata TaxID=307507 RepID=A0A2V0P7E2_9CHLO|nr:photosystem II reaction center X [Raphidocelis subcapitata]|eukprot:GBF93107.1 photosystem II reaction center X [Raphidocelis subcapitata]